MSESRTPGEYYTKSECSKPNQRETYVNYTVQCSGWSLMSENYYSLEGITVIVLGLSVTDLL